MLLPAPQRKEWRMERHKLDGELAERIINTLRNNPGVDMTLADLSDETGIDVDELAAYLDDLVQREYIDSDTTTDGFDVYRFHETAQRGSMAPSNS
jgi:predicted transcriptional regulator